MHISRLMLQLVSIFLIFFAGLLFFTNSTLSPPEDNLALGSQASNCHKELPFWSRGFARSCCDVFPTSFSKHRGGFFEGGELSDSTYFLNSQLKTGDVIYIATADFPQFLPFFLKLDHRIRLTLVTGGEDIGTPWELFHPNRGFGDYRMSALWPEGQMASMRQFLGDARLHRWYAQNYDLVGNTSFTRSDVDALLEKDIVAKVFPMPIGLDFHSLAEKNKALSKAQASRSVCSQKNDLAAALAQAPPFLDREASVFAKFECNFPDSVRAMRELSRGTICRLIAAHLFNTSRIESLGDRIITAEPSGADEARGKSTLASRKQSFWKQVTKVQFSLAPPGLGTDTHRVWEILNLHCVPIVLSSPLNVLYGMFPVIIVKDWSEVFEKGALIKFRNTITTRFGDNPFTKDVQEMLRASYWIDTVRNASQIIDTSTRT